MPPTKAPVADPFLPAPKQEEAGPPATVKFSLVSAISNLDLLEVTLRLSGLPDPRQMLRHRFADRQAQWKKEAAPWQEYQTAWRMLLETEKRLADVKVARDAAQAEWLAKLERAEEPTELEGKYQAATAAEKVQEERLQVLEKSVSEKKQAALAAWNREMEGLIQAEQQFAEAAVVELRRVLLEHLADDAAVFSLHSANSLHVILKTAPQGLAPPL
jgi:hypothetical protein